ncbi:MAG TPA: terminase TerL endonuclease subunit [Stenotrophobium sp.]|nr:terminase TerL endonuclease subunit [Stenotrophobium sp.]
MKKKRQTASSTTASGKRDYVATAMAYAREAVADKKRQRFCKWTRLAAKRFLTDLKTARRPRSAFVFDEWHACDACDFIEKLPHVEGRWDTPTIALDPFQVFFVVNLFGFRNRDGTRRFTSALLALARKNAKSTLGAAILLYCLCCEDEPGPQIVSAATTGDQARIVFNVAKRMVERTPDLQEAFDIKPFANAIASFRNGGSFKPINAKASTQDGLNPSATVLDEVHAHKTAELLDVLQSAAGARRNPLWLYTTTEGYETPGPWPELRKFAQQVLEGVVEADHFLALIYALDDGDDDFDETKFVKANPLLDASPILQRELHKAAAEAKAMPGRLAEFRIKRLNRQASAANGWIDLPKWKRCDGAVDLDALAGLPCWAALDLASTTDMAAWRLVWQREDRLLTWGRRWVPGAAVKRRALRGTVPYEAWHGAGLIEATPGDVIDYEVIEARIREDVERFNPTLIAFDRWNAVDLVNRLTKDELPMIEFVQGPKSYHPAMQELERLYLAGKLVHGGDPVLQWCASNLVVRYDANMNMAPDKKRSPEKIDDMAALLMAIGVSQGEPEDAPVTLGSDYSLMVA